MFLLKKVQARLNLFLPSNNMKFKNQQQTFYKEKQKILKYLALCVKSKSIWIRWEISFWNLNKIVQTCYKIIQQSALRKLIPLKNNCVEEIQLLKEKLESKQITASLVWVKHQEILNQWQELRFLKRKRKKLQLCKNGKNFLKQMMKKFSSLKSRTWSRKLKKTRSLLLRKEKKLIKMLLSLSISKQMKLKPLKQRLSNVEKNWTVVVMI